jgi:hypothetical protein
MPGTRPGMTEKKFQATHFVVMAGLVPAIHGIQQMSP